MTHLELRLTLFGNRQIKLLTSQCYDRGNLVQCKSLLLKIFTKRIAGFIPSHPSWSPCSNPVGYEPKPQVPIAQQLLITSQQLTRTMSEWERLLDNSNFQIGEFKA
jgi:hypothetical protein